MKHKFLIDGIYLSKGDNCLYYNLDIYTDDRGRRISKLISTFMMKEEVPRWDNEHHEHVPMSDDEILVIPEEFLNRID